MIVKITGGLGNQMFQYAFAKATQKKFHINKMQLDIDFYNDKKIHNGFELKKIFSINEKYCKQGSIQKYIDKIFVKYGYFKKKKSIKIFNRFYEVSLGFFPEYEKFDLENMYLDGYWQSEEYFYDYQNLIKETFKFPAIESVENKRIVDKILHTNSVSIHVRRGDYLSSDRYICLGETNYYQQAIKLITEKIDNPTFFIFSDDIDWCRNNLALSEEYEIVDWNKGDKSYVDLQLMSMCKHNVIANSSFSWWGAWLNINENKIVVSPEHFYKLESGFDDSHLLPKSWIKLPVIK